MTDMLTNMGAEWRYKWNRKKVYKAPAIRKCGVGETLKQLDAMLNMVEAPGKSVVIMCGREFHSERGNKGFHHERWPWRIRAWVTPSDWNTPMNWMREDVYVYEGDELLFARTIWDQREESEEDILKMEHWLAERGIPLVRQNGQERLIRRCYRQNFKL